MNSSSYHLFVPIMSYFVSTLSPLHFYFLLPLILKNTHCLFCHFIFRNELDLKQRTSCGSFLCFFSHWFNNMNVLLCAAPVWGCNPVTDGHYRGGGGGGGIAEEMDGESGSFLSPKTYKSSSFIWHDSCDIKSGRQSHGRDQLQVSTTYTQE